MVNDKKLSSEKLREWFGWTKGGALKTVNFFGYPGILVEYKNVFNFLRESGAHINYYILWKDFLQVRETELIPSDFNKVILYAGDALEKIDSTYDAVFLVSSDEEIHMVEKILLKKKDFGKKVELIPVYTGKNLDFFRECIYTSKEELFTGSLSKQEILPEWS